MNYPNQPQRRGPTQYGPPPGGHQPWPPPALPTVRLKKRRGWLWIVLGVVAFIALALVFTNNTTTAPVSNPAGSAPTPTAPAPSGNTATVTYEIIGKSKASNVTYNTDGGASIAQEANVKLPWRKEIHIERGSATATLTAQNGGAGELTCRVSVDGQIVKEATSSGQFAVVSCASEPIT